MMRFFKEEVMQPRFPRTREEGAIKGLMLGAMIFGPYDALSAMPKTMLEQRIQSQNVLTGYVLFVFFGTLCGLVGECCLHEQREDVPRIGR